MANGETEKNSGLNEGNMRHVSSGGTFDCGLSLSKILAELGEVDCTVRPLQRGVDHLGSRLRPDMHVDYLPSDTTGSEETEPRVIKVDPSMIITPVDVIHVETRGNRVYPQGGCIIVGDVQITPRNVEYSDKKAKEMRDAGCSNPKGCEQVNVQHLPSVNPGSRSYGSIGRGMPYIDKVDYKNVTGQVIEIPNSVEIDDTKS